MLVGYQCSSRFSETPTQGTKAGSDRTAHLTSSSYATPNLYLHTQTLSPVCNYHHLNGVRALRKTEAKHQSLRKHNPICPLCRLSNCRIQTVIYWRGGGNGRLLLENNIVRIDTMLCIYIKVLIFLQIKTTSMKKTIYHSSI